MLILRLLRYASREQGGFTLIELVVAMLISGVIVVVLLTVLTFTTRQTSLLTEKVQATRTGRQTMTKVIDELHSACISSGISEYYPVREGSNPTKLIFDNAYSKQASIPSASENASEGVYQHEIVFNEKEGTLVDNAFASTSVSAWPVVSFASTSTKHLLGENLSQTPEKNEKTGKTEPGPVFKYYKYAQTATSTSSTTKGLETLVPIEYETTKGLEKEQAAEVAAVLVSFTASPSSHNKEFNRTFSLSSQVTFAFTSPSSETPISDSPCE
jgi:prepilin-type N-terminal cleavage/methylation domain-containing protein